MVAPAAINRRRKQNRLATLLLHLQLLLDRLRALLLHVFSRSPKWFVVLFLAGYIFANLLEYRSPNSDDDVGQYLLAVNATRTPPPDASKAMTTTTSTPTSTTTSTTTTTTPNEYRRKAKEECDKFLQGVGARVDQSALVLKEQVDRTIAAQMMVVKNREDGRRSDDGLSSSPPKSFQATHRPTCRHVFLDLGTNIGDTIGIFVDVALDICTPLWMEQHPPHATGKPFTSNLTFWSSKFPRPRFNVSSLEIDFYGRRFMNPTHLFIHDTLQRLDLQPEEVCVVGVEGNPVFTSRLQRLESFLQHDLRPKFFHDLRMFTETVVTTADGPTKLYLDQVSAIHNFWGSSIIDSLKEVEETAKQNGGNLLSANVSGWTLGSLLHEVMPDGIGEMKEGHNAASFHGGNLMIKMDIEGAEYAVLKQVANSGVLCDYARSNKVILLVEFHHRKAIQNGTQFVEAKTGIQKAKNILGDCGVVFENLLPGWT